ncbi:MAG: glycosyltransferase [Bryobacteraceae bacterium]
MDRLEIRAEEKVKALVIPAYQPSESLLHLLQDLTAGLFAAIVVVDDGSGPAYAEIFARVAAFPNVQIVRHAVPIGRGAALRTGIHAALSTAPHLTAVVTTDITHSAKEVAWAHGLRRTRDSLVLVTRQPPPRSIATLAVTWALTGQPLSEPETTLRSIPAALLPHLLRMESNGPEFEVETLLVAGQHSIPVLEEQVGQPAEAQSQLAGESACPTEAQAIAQQHGTQRGTDAFVCQPADPRPSPAASTWFAPLALLKFAIESRPYRAVGFAFALLTAAILIAATVSEIRGFATGHLFSQPIWLPWGQRRLAHFATLFAAFSLPLLLLFPWAYASAFTALVTGATVLATGPLAVAAVVFFLASAWALGSRLLGKSDYREPETHVCATLLGIAIYAFAMTLTARIPVNYPAAWAAVVAIPILLDARGVIRRFRQLTALLRSISLPNWPERSAFALLAFVLCIHWFAALEPETSSDGLAMHLAVPANIAAHHAMTYQPDLFLWSVMPMGADFSYAIVYLLGGEPAVSLFNLALLLSIAAIVYSANRRWLPRAPALVVTALFVSTPLVHLVTGSLFIENFVAAMILGALAGLWRFRETGRRNLLFAAAALAGAASAAKLGACIFALLAVAFAVAEVRRQWKNLGARPAVTAALAAALLVAVASPPYLIAYAKTGNPVFPFLNTRLPSPMLERGLDFRDSRFHKPLAWTTPFNLTFHTGDYFEAQNGAFGFQYLLLIPLALVALLAAPNYAAKTAATIALAAGAIIMATQPNARYVYAALPLFAISFGALLARFAAQQRWMTRALLAAALIFIGLNVYFEAASGWYHRHFYSLSLFRPNGRDLYLRETAPMRDVTQRFRLAQPLEPVLLVTENDLTDAGDRVYEYEWHQYAVWKSIATVKSVSALRQVFASHGIRYFIAHRTGPDEDPIFPMELGEFLANCTAPQFENGRFYAARMIPECESLGGADLEAWLAKLPPALVSPGIYDDSDPALRFHGIWTRSREFARPYRHSISYTNIPGADVTFAFQGESLTYVYTKAPNRGLARIEIDGVAHAIDLYSPSPQWQTRTQFCCLAPGRHLVVLRATGEKQPQSQGVYIDLDAFIAK